MKVFLCLLALTVAGASAAFINLGDLGGGNGWSSGGGGWSNGGGGWSNGGGSWSNGGGGWSNGGGWSGGGQTKVIKVIREVPVVHHVQPVHVKVIKVVDHHDSYGHDHGHGHGHGHSHGWSASPTVVKVIKVHDGGWNSGWNGWSKK